MYLQYLYVLHPKALDLSYTSACYGLHEAACDALGLDIAWLPHRRTANQATGGTPREITLHREFCANIRSAVSQKKQTFFSSVQAHQLTCGSPSGQ